jgi:hypothetical protein
MRQSFCLPVSKNNEQCKLLQPQNLSDFVNFCGASNIRYFELKLCMLLELNIAYI